MVATGRIALAALALAGCATGGSARNGDANPKVAMSEDFPVKSKRAASATETALPRSTHAFPAAYSGAEALPAVRGESEIVAHDGKLARVMGTYLEMDVRMRPSPPVRHVGHAAIRLADGTTVSLLPVWDEDARRPEAEVAQFKDREVEVVGTIYAEAPQDPHGGASPTGPCVDEVKAIRLAR